MIVGFAIGYDMLDANICSQKLVDLFLCKRSSPEINSTLVVESANVSERSYFVQSGADSGCLGWIIGAV